MDKIYFNYSIEHLTYIIFETTDEETRRLVIAFKISGNSDEQFSQKNALVTIEIRFYKHIIFITYSHPPFFSSSPSS